MNVAAPASRPGLRAWLGARDRLRFQATILENIRESVIVTDLEGRVTYWGQGASEIFGYSAEEMTGETIQRLYPDESPPAPADLVRILAGIDYNGLSMTFGTVSPDRHVPSCP